MKIIYYDGSELLCYGIDIVDDGRTLVADDIYIVPIREVLRIVEE